MPSLEDMDVHDVFERRLDELVQTGKAGEDQAAELRATYAAAVRDLLQNDGAEECAS